MDNLSTCPKTENYSNGHSLDNLANSEQISGGESDFTRWLVGREGVEPWSRGHIHYCLRTRTRHKGERVQGYFPVFSPFRSPALAPLTLTPSCPLTIVPFYPVALALSYPLALVPSCPCTSHPCALLPLHPPVLVPFHPCTPLPLCPPTN